MKKIKVYLILFLLLILFITISASSYALNVSSDISNSVFRLHVIANSDSKEDQNLKYLVRDNILNYFNNNSINLENKTEVINFINLNLNNIQKVAEDTIKENNYNYPVTLEIGNFDFPTKKYGDISLPNGKYDALRVKIGNASGKNWWCVMFPPLCFVDVSSGIVDDNSKKLLSNNLNQEEYALISSENNSYEFKFKILEFFNNLNLIIAKK